MSDFLQNLYSTSKNIILKGKDKRKTENEKIDEK